MEATAIGPDMHCGGCGAKLPASLLRGALAEVASVSPEHVAPEQLRDDAAVLDWPAGKPLVQSVDTLRALVDDPWLMGRITALHALSDLYAMGATPHSAQVHVCLAYAAPALQSRELVQLMSGLLAELSSAGCRLVGGHSMEGPELSLGLTLNGIPGTTTLPKSGARTGDRLILTKPLGTGVIFATAMAGRAGGAALAAAIESMLLSNRSAAALASEHAVSACTDVTGFGLAGHLQEMLEAGQQARLDLDALPLLEGADEFWQAGFRSTLHPGNEASANLPGTWPPALFDPQTSGGLLLALPAARAPALLGALQDSGHGAACIGEVVTRPADGARIAAG